MVTLRELRFVLVVLLALLVGLACNLPVGPDLAGEGGTGSYAEGEMTGEIEGDQDTTPPTASPIPPTAAPTATPAATPFGGGSMIAYISDQDSAAGDLFVAPVGAEGVGQPIKLTNNDDSYSYDYNGPSWHPSGEAVTVASNNYEESTGSIITLPLEPGEPVITNFSQQTQLLYYAPIWSPADDEFIFTQMGEAGAELMLFSIGGSGPRAVVSGQGYQIGLDWSARGILYLETLDLGELNPNYSADLYRLAEPEAERGLMVQGIVGLNLARYSPAGDQIVYDSIENGNGDVYLMSADGSGVRRLTESSEHEGSPAWSPDGRYLLFTRQVGPGDRDIYLMNADGTDQRPLINGPGNQSEAVWGP